MKFFVWPCIGALLGVSPGLALAQDGAALSASSSVELAVPAGVRLGAWLSQNHPDLGGGMYAPGLMWLDPAQARPQAQEKLALLAELSSVAVSRPELASRMADLRQLLSSMPVTGRRLLAVQDPWLMQLHSDLEPVSGSGHVLKLSGRPDRVRVMQAQPVLCDVLAEPGRAAADYLQACGVNSKVDVVWLIQPDGQVRRLGLGAWNAEVQDAPAPGAWLWVPTGVSDDVNRRVAQVIATQGVAQALADSALQLPAAVRLPTRAGARPAGLPSQANDWGVTGLMQTPTARTPGAGHVGLTVSRVWPYTHTTLSMSPFDSVELGFRYTRIANKLYGPEIAGSQAYLDKSSEVKWRMLDETAARPAVAVGLRDPGGTGLFAGEYVVASKRWNSLDMSLGLGWGYLGGRGNLSNPLRVLGQRFATRQSSEVGVGGTAHLSSMFTGPVALLGGVQWQTPVPELALKLELDGNNYKHEPFGNDVGGARSPWNWGLSWTSGPLSLNLGYERGRQWLFGLTLATDVSKISRSKRSEPAAWPVSRPPQAGTSLPTSNLTGGSAQLVPVVASVSRAGVGAAVASALAEQIGWSVHDVRQEGRVWVVELQDAVGFSLPERLDRGMAVVHAMAPEDVQSVRFVLMQQGVPVSSRVMDRTTWADARYAWRGQPAVHESVAGPAAALERSEGSPRKPVGTVGLGFQQNVGGPDGYLYSVNATAQGQWPLWQGAWVQGTAKARLVDNYDKYRYTAPSNLPRVRTYVREYQTSERITLPNVQFNQLNQWGDGLYSLAYAGALESMFAGVGAEVMWRPLGSRWAVGADMNRLAQRDFDQRWSLRDYRVNSGHITAYWDSGWQGVEAKLMVGQYLAGDRGATVEVSRRFNNGARMGAWITKTNVPAATFGEGSFDKGVFISLPFDAFLSAWSKQNAYIAWQPLIRDGGARLDKSQSLWNITNSRDEREWLRP